MKKIIDTHQCAVGDHAVLTGAVGTVPACLATRLDYVTAEEKARDYVERHPGQTAYVAVVVKQFTGRSHAYEVTKS